MKRAIAIILSFILLSVSLFSCAQGGTQSTSGTSSTTDGSGKDPAIADFMGDANGDGKTDSADHELLVAYLAGEASEIHYEFCDLNGDLAVDSADAELLLSYLNGEKVEIAGKPFANENADVTSKLVDLGLNNGDVWSGNKLISRNPFDMIASNGVVMVSGGNYNSNTGPVIINGYTRDSESPIVMGSLDSEQINRFYDCGNYIAAVSIDQKSTWGFSDLFIKPADSNEWGELNNVLVENIHCYDMVYFNGSYFLCGSSVSYKNVDGTRVELFKPSVYRADAPLSADMTADDFLELEAYNASGYLVDYDEGLEFDGNTRFYDLFVFDGKLYAFCFNGSLDDLGEEYNHNGIYVYNESNDEFSADDSLNVKGLIDVFTKGTIQHDFEFGGKYYFISSTLFSTDDFSEYSQFVIEGYEDYSVRDVIFRGDKAYLLAGEKHEDCFVNVVLETSDFESFRPILNFESGLFARSFEFCNGSFYFGLGYDFTGYISSNLKECGRIYRYDYYR